MTKLKNVEEMYQDYLDEKANKKINKQFVKKPMKQKPQSGIKKRPVKVEVEKND